MNKLKVVILLLLMCFPLLSKEGKASYYHDKFHGRMTASGTIFNQNEMTCAHKTLPFGTKLEVTNLTNNKTVVVTVTDRGPFIKGRHIDLSYAAAEKLDFINKGVQRVNFEIIKPSRKRVESSDLSYKPQTLILTVLPVK
jgi:rare lipoprotein A